MKFCFAIAVLYTVLFAGQCNDDCQHGSLRLVNGTTSNRGRLEICINFIWGTVCDDSFDINDARVACRQLGYEVDQGQNVSYNIDAYYGQGSGPIWLNHLYCTGNEQSLLDCRKFGDIGNHYGCNSHVEDVSINCPVNSCTENAVRLVDGLVSTDGTIEICLNGAWTTICSNNWDYKEAFVVCRQLGLPATDALAIILYGTGHGIPTLTSWLCYGNETYITNCTHSTSSCFSTYSGYYSIAGVRCQGEIISGTSCSSGNLRLVDSSGSNMIQGRVEYCTNGIWGTVNSNGFDTRDGQVVCRRLGYQQPRII
jgi:deleted-in-malignant-brain-tumors protein 1